LLLDTSAPSLAVPLTAVRDDAGTSSVLAIVDGRISEVAVVPGRRGVADAGPEMVEIRTGLAPGAQVVRQFDARLTPGSAAAIASVPAASR
jgi:hypothetical protein